MPVSEIGRTRRPVEGVVFRQSASRETGPMQKRLASVYRSGRPYMMAVVLGTALSAMPSSAIAGAPSCPETTLKAIADMNRYCSTCWRNARLPMDSWTDCTQEVFKKLLERVPQDGWD